MASRESMNMGSRSSNVISEIKSLISGVRQESSLLKQEWTSINSTMSSGLDKFRGAFGGGPRESNSLVAPNPVFNAPAIVPMNESGNVIAAGPSASIVGGGGFRSAGTDLTAYAASTGAATLYQPEAGTIARGGGGSSGGGGGPSGGGSGGSGNNQNPMLNLPSLPLIGNLMSAAYAIYNTTSNLTPSTSDALEAQLLQQRASFYTGGGKSGIGAIQASQQSIANAAMLSGDNPQMDVMRAQIAAQSYGLMGPSANALLQSAANVSNLMPGLGVEGAIRTTGAMQQAYNVNMLRGIGIQLRGPDGTMKGPDQVIDDVWTKICRDYSQAYGANKTPSLKEVQISLQPGNALDSMLNQYFGNDPMLKQLVANGLIYKAQGGGAVTKGGVEALGGTTAAMLSYTTTAAAGQAFLTAAEAPAAGGPLSGFIGANQRIIDYYNNAGQAFINTLQGVKGFTDTILTAFGGSPASAALAVGAGVIGGFFKTPITSVTNDLNTVFNTTDLSGLMNSSTSVTGRAVGGPVSGSTPYIVGEKGPELFIPDNNGTIVPNNKLGSGSTYNYSFTINAASGSTQDLVTEIKSVLVQLETNRKVSES